MTALCGGVIRSRVLWLAPAENQSADASIDRHSVGSASRSRPRGFERVGDSDVRKGRRQNDRRERKTPWGTRLSHRVLSLAAQVHLRASRMLETRISVRNNQSLAKREKARGR